MDIKEKFVSNWKQVLKTYSFVFHAVAVVVTIIDVVLPHMSLLEPVMDHTTYGVVMFVLNVAGGIGRLIKQPEVMGNAKLADK